MLEFVFSDRDKVPDLFSDHRILLIFRFLILIVDLDRFLIGVQSKLKMSNPEESGRNYFEALPLEVRFGSFFWKFISELVEVVYK